jgi:drug/metabolite transporter (DMT)-like permease
VGYLYVAFYVILVGLATFFMKTSLKQLDPFQLNLLMGIGMIVTGAIALYFANKSFRIPVKELPVGIGIGTAMAIGSIFYVLALNNMTASVASVLAATYVIVVIVLSWLFLKESFDFIKIAGVICTFVGVVLLTYRS